MRTLIGSDLHTEYNQLEVNRDGSQRAKFLLLAGDIASQQGLESTLRDLSDLAEHVIYVPGNHEYYGHSIVEVDSYISQLQMKLDNFYMLQKTALFIDGIRFVGCTLWSDMLNGDWRVMDTMRRYGDDFKKIVNASGDDYITPEELVLLNADHSLWLKRELERPNQHKTVVLTHFAPSINCRDPRYPIGDPVARYMCNSQLENLINYGYWDLWVYGHIHHEFDEKVGEDRRMICHPRGTKNTTPNFDFKQIQL